jgi:hypothetical protein
LVRWDVGAPMDEETYETAATPGELGITFEGAQSALGSVDQTLRPSQAMRTTP